MHSRLEDLSISQARLKAHTLDPKVCPIGLGHGTGSFLTLEAMRLKPETCSPPTSAARERDSFSAAKHQVKQANVTRRMMI
jgi:hypothetical protein